MWQVSTDPRYSDRLAASLVNTHRPFMFSTSAIGIILRPGPLMKPASAAAAKAMEAPKDVAADGVAAIWCSYPFDGGSMRQEDRVHGCSDDPVTCFPPEELWHMMWTQQIGWAKRFTRHCLYGDPDGVDRSGCGYNEIVLRGDAYRAALPGVVEAFFVPRGDEFIHHAEGDLARATAARAAFLKQYKRKVSANDVPLLAFDLGASRDGKPPFAFADEPPDADALCSCPDLVDRTRRPRHRECAFCPQ